MGRSDYLGRGLPLHRSVIMWGVLHSLWVCLCFVILQKMGFFPVLGDPYVRPR
jgi:hypothetical protein